MKSRERNNSLNIDWHRLSTVEFASALEVYAIARQFDHQPKMQRSILEHTLDEYRHAELFGEIARAESKYADTSINIHKLIEWGGISSENVNAPPLIESIVLFLQGEKRAETFLEELKRSNAGAVYKERINLVLEDETNHVSGIESFLKHCGLLNVLKYKLILSIRFLGGEVSHNSKVEYLREKAFSFLVKIILKFPIEKFALSEDSSVTSLRKSVESARRMT